MTDLLASIVADPTPLPLWGVLAVASMLYPVGYMLGSGCCCSPCSECAGSQIIFTAAAGTQFTIPTVANQALTINAGVAIATNGGTGAFQGATGWTNALGIDDVQSFAVNVNGPGVAVGGDRDLDVRFNRFTLVGTCNACGVVIIPTSDSFGGGAYPSDGVGGNAGNVNAGTVRAGDVYALPEITFDIPGCDDEAIGQLSIEAISGGAYTITLQATALP